ncbi:MAG TPA: DNA-directed RNA polymerase subunit beta [Patescibacteria group bacterium]|nr:DNA-directed RNA polymerase subunit beta [Patescibacteria group bacterium]
MPTSSRRRFFTNIRETVDLPDLVEVQKNSYNWLLKEGLRELFDEVSPIKDFTGRDLELYFEDYYLSDAKFDEKTTRAKNATYEAPMRIKARLVNQRTGRIIEQEVYLGDIPLMTNHGTFVINGVERVIVSQLIRSAGIFFTAETIGDRRFYGAKIIPNRGAWLEFETDANGVVWVKIDRKRKVPATTLLRAFGYMTTEEIAALFKDLEKPSEVSIRETLEKDPAKNEGEGLKEVYKRIRPGDLATIENARDLIMKMFFTFERYDLGRVGRYKINHRFGYTYPVNKEHRTLKREDIIAVLREIIKLNQTQGPADDIDHLGNRRIRTVGELLQNRFRIGLARMERIIKDRMSTMDIDTITPAALVNARPVIGVIKEFFMSSQLSQFMDQANPLSELEHKRRLSAMGPGGLSRERAGFDVRDVHRTHYGRICPIATSEGPNIGLIGHLCTYGRINDFGFIETPYRKILKEVANEASVLANRMADTDLTGKNGDVVVKSGEIISETIAKAIEKHVDQKTIPVKPFVTNELVFMDAFEEERYVTTAAVTPVDGNGNLMVEKVEARVHGEPSIAEPQDVQFMDVSSRQIISVSTSLIPFLEHDDAVRALMGTNMQRQAVPCIHPQAPYVGTGIEGRVALDSGQAAIAKSDGVIKEVDAKHVVVEYDSGETDSHELVTFRRTNTSTCVHQRVAVDRGQRVQKGDVLINGAAVDEGELALGQNALVAFMSWEGGNYEDAILISERLVQKDHFTSIHIEDYQVDVRDTKLGPEIVTRDIPNVSEEKLKDLDETGIVRIGAKVSSGDILVGKITPKGETELTAEERLLRAIFGEKAKDVRDSSLYLEHGEYGKVVDVKIFSRDKGDKLQSGVIESIQVTVANLRKVQVGDKMAGRHGNKGVISRVVAVEDMPYLADGTPLDIILNPLGVASRMNLGQILETHLGLAASKLGYKVATPPFNGVAQSIIRSELQRAGFPSDGKLTLYDGRTGQQFDEKVTVGYMYMMKLNHMVDDKIHQRSIGPYSLVTQQPLGGRAQFGGQRFGEMEVWALEAYGAAHTLQEILTIKSDDVPGRSKAYEAIIKGQPIDRLNIPESFHVLVRELKSLGLSVELLNNKGQVMPERSDIGIKGRIAESSSDAPPSSDSSA